MIDQAIRRQGIGGSEIAAVLNIDDRRDAHSIWVAKRDEFPAPAPTEEMQMGHAFQAAILNYYAHRERHEIEHIDETFVHPERPYQVYSPDGICIDERRGVDAKLVLHPGLKWGPTPDDIPPSVRCQAHWYMSATNIPFWDIAALTPDGFRVYTFERDLELECEMLRRAEDFWRRYLIGNEIPPIGGSEDSRRWVHSRFPRNVDSIRPANAEEIELLEMYAQVRDDEDVLTAQRDRLENELKLAIATADGLTWARGRLTWKTTKDSEKVDYGRLAKSLLKNYAAAERQALEHEFTDTKPGVRRLLLRYDGEKAKGLNGNEN